MPSNSFKLSGSMPPWPAICKSKLKNRPKPPAFPPALVNAVLSLNYLDMELNPANWLGNVPCPIEVGQGPSWHGNLTIPSGQVEVFFTCGPTGAAPTIAINAQLPNAFAQANYNGATANSISLTPYVSGPLTIDGPMPSLPSLASVVG